MRNLLSPGDIFVDVGANIGLMSVYASGLVADEGSVFAFEPNPETARILHDNIDLNSCTNIEVSEYAVGKKPGKAMIYDNWDSNRGSASMIPPEGQAEEEVPTKTGSYEVEIVALSDFFRGRPELKEEKQISHKERWTAGRVRKAQIIKFDIEGYELEALEGARDLLYSEHPPILVVECSVARENTSGFTTDALWDFFTEMNRYTLFRGKKDKSRVSKLVKVKKREELPSHDNIYCFAKTHFAWVPSRIFADPPM
jgi:FkbM family methyltransferase